MPPEEDVDATVTRLMAPYSEEIQVDPYERHCWCVGREARQEVKLQINDEFGDMDTFRKDFWEKRNSQPGRFRMPENPDDRTESDWKAMDAQDGLDNEAWREYSRDRFSKEESLLKVHPRKDASDADCADCAGTGKDTTTYNPKSKWDWYVIGGRYNGVMSGTPRDDGNGGFNFDAEFHELPENSICVDDIPEGFSCFAIVTPDGEWHERGNMGWWGMVSDENDAWAPLEILKKFPKHPAVGLDCHI